MRSLRYTLIALLLAVLASQAAFAVNNDAVVRSAGTPEARGIYRQCGTFGGKPFYNKLDQPCNSSAAYALRANGLEWEIYDGCCGPVYTTIGGLDFAFPWLANGIFFGAPTGGSSGSAPPPSVTMGLSLKNRLALPFVMFSRIDDDRWNFLLSGSRTARNGGDRAKV